MPDLQVNGPRPKLSWEYAARRLQDGLKHRGFIFAIITLIVSAGTLIWVFMGEPSPESSRNLETIMSIQGFVLLAWVLGPPMYFFFEYFFLWETLDDKNLENLKEYQSRAKDIWLAVAAVLAFLFGLANFPA